MEEEKSALLADVQLIADLLFASNKQKDLWGLSEIYDDGAAGW